MSAPGEHLVILSGASRGLGLAMTRALLASGHQLITLSRQAPDLSQDPSATGALLAHWSLDLADGGEAASQRLGEWLHAQAQDHFASATLINNAALIPPAVPLREASGPDLAQALRVGLEAPMRLAATFLGGTRAWAGPRKLLNISSGLGRRPMAAQAPYAAVKAGLDHFSRCLALEEAALPGGARVCSLAPGVIDTDMQLQLRSASSAGFPDRARFEQLHRDGQLTPPDEAARLVLAWLARPDFGAQPVADVRDPA